MKGEIQNTDYGWMVKYSNPCCYEMFEIYAPLHNDTDKKYLTHGNVVEFDLVILGFNDIAIPTKIIKENKVWM